MQAMGRPVLEVRDLHVHYKGHHAVRGVSLTVEDGERLVVMGPSGAGKSTLVKAIPRLVKPTSGTILLEGECVSCADRKTLRRLRARMGYVPQSYSLFPHLRVIDNIVLPLVRVHKLPKKAAVERAMRHLEMLGIGDLASRYPAQLSGGQRQRAALARALALDPAILLLDEPTSALDPESRSSVVDALYRIARSGRSMLIVTHEADFALQVADRLVFMEEGRIVVMAPPGEALRHERVRQFLSSILEN